MPTKRKPKSALITQAEYARRRGLNKSTISRQVRDGIIPTHGAKRLLDPAEADKARETKTDPTRGRRKEKAPAKTSKAESKPKTPAPPDTPADSPPRPPGTVSYADERAYGQQLKNRQAEIELARLREELIDRDAVRKAVAELAQASVAAWIQWPARVYAEMAAELGVDGATLHHVLDKHVRRHADEISHAPLEFRSQKKKSA